MERHFQQKVNNLSAKYSKLAGKINEKTEIYHREIENGSFASSETFSLEENSNNQVSENSFQSKIQEIEKMDLERLIVSIKELSDALDQISVVAFEKGDVVDRIDISVLESGVTAKNENLELARAVENQEDGLGEKCLRVLSVLIIILTFFLLWKFSE